jgi:hypothetical protein
MRRSIRIAVIVLALAIAPVAAAVGPYLIGASNGPPGVTSLAGVRYTTSTAGGKTTLTATSGGRLLRRAVLEGAWGVPVVTETGPLGGLSHDGRTLVLAVPVQQLGRLRTTTRFAIVSTRTLAIVRTVRVAGDFGFDALSPAARTLFLIQHLSTSDTNRYQVRAYDLRSGQLARHAIVDKREHEWIMSGDPVSRATSADGRWVYTLYSEASGSGFVHALDTMTRTAVCVDLPAGGGTSFAYARVSLADGGGKLAIRADNGSGERLTMNTRTLSFS